MKPGVVTRGAPGIAIGLLLIVLGLFPTLAALNVIPTPDADFGAPRWLVALIVQPFIVFGVGVVLTALGFSTRVFHAFGYATALIFVTFGSMLWVYILMSGDTGSSAMIGIGPIAMPLPGVIARPLNRVVVALAALLTIGIAIVMWIDALRRWIGRRAGGNGR